MVSIAVGESTGDQWGIRVQTRGDINGPLTKQLPKRTLRHIIPFSPYTSRLI